MPAANLGEELNPIFLQFKDTYSHWCRTTGWVEETLKVDSTILETMRVPTNNGISPGIVQESRSSVCFYRSRQNFSQTILVRYCTYFTEMLNFADAVSSLAVL